MERDAAISYGASSFLRERLMLVSDAYQTVFCKTCGTFAVNDPTNNSYKQCRLCGNNVFGRCTIPYTYKLLIHLLGAIGINLRPEFMTSEEYKERIFRKGAASKSTIDDIKNSLEEADFAEETEEDQFEEEDYGLDLDGYGGDDE